MSYPLPSEQTSDDNFVIVMLGTLHSNASERFFNKLDNLHIRRDAAQKRKAQVRLSPKTLSLTDGEVVLIRGTDRVNPVESQRSDAITKSRLANGADLKVSHRSVFTTLRL